MRRLFSDKRTARWNSLYLKRRSVGEWLKRQTELHRQKMKARFNHTKAHHHGPEFKRAEKRRRRLTRTQSR